MVGLGSEDLREREKVLVSNVMIAQIVNESWSELLTSIFGASNRCLVMARQPTRS